MPQVKAGRKTSRGVIVRGNEVLLIERWRTADDGEELHYFSVPGGKIEPGETPEVAVVRELFEETSLLTRPIKLLAKQTFKNGDTNAYYLCEYLSGSPELHSSAPEEQLPTNRSLPRWVEYSELESLRLNEVYEPVRKLIVAVFKGELPEKPLRIK